MPLVLGVDSSTQSTKVELRDADDGTLVGAARAPHPAVHPPCSEQDPEAWWEALRSAAAEATADGTHDVAAVSVAAQQHGMVVLDGAGRPLRAAKLWNDTESAPEAAAMVAGLGAGEWATRTGSVPVAAFTVTKLAWLARHEPGTARAVRSVLLPHDYLTYRLTGRMVTDRGDASGTGYFDPAGGAWLPGLLEEVVGPGDWAARLPAVLGPTEAAGPLGAAGAAALDIGRTGLVGPGTGDNMAAALGLGLAPGRVAISIGTSGTVFARSAGPSADPTGTVDGFADAAGGFLPLVCTLNATRVTGAVARLLGVTDEGLDALAFAGPSGASGTTLLPYFDGERTPDRPAATGVLAGLRSEVTREDLARAAVEGVVCGLLDALDALAAVVPAEEGPLLLAGGGARSPAFRRVLADLSGRPVLVSDLDEAVATGAAVQAAAVLTGRPLDEVQTAWGLGGGSTVEPDGSVDAAAVRDAYAALRAGSQPAPTAGVAPGADRGSGAR
ncbi:MAG TPA: xylulokinase [Acidimicrobiales bacterium]|nr:xylulokinase [Acidimicrobiales bacterium]